MTRLGIVTLNVALGSVVVLLTRPVVAFGSFVWTETSTFTAAQLEWFATSKPAGVKLHPQLSQALSLIGLQYISIVRAVCVALQGASSFSYNGVEYNVFHGVVFMLGVLTALKGPHVLSRGVGLLTVPITLASVAMYKAARFHLWLTGLFWRFMREDGSAYKLALSCLLFMPVVLTLPTTIWYDDFWLISSFHPPVHS